MYRSVTMNCIQTFFNAYYCLDNIKQFLAEYRYVSSIQTSLYNAHKFYYAV